MLTEEQRRALNDVQTDFFSKLRLASSSNLVVSERTDKSNLSAGVFRKLIGQIPSTTKVNYEQRQSRKGPFGGTGEDQVFFFVFSVTLLGKSTSYYVKGFFFHRGKIEGVYLQSFRKQQLKVIK